MPTTYLLLRNNKQTGPHSLEGLLQQGLKPNDLIWIEGQSSGWCYPADIAALKLYVKEATAAPLENPSNTSASQTVVKTKTERNYPLHIYVSLPAHHTPEAADKGQTNSSLEEKAEALYQRVHAFTEGRPVEETDTRYARSLADMKQEYGAWQVRQQKKKKQGTLKKKVLIVASVLVVTTTGFGINKWISHKSVLKGSLADYTVATESPDQKKQSTVVAFNVTAPTFPATTSNTAVLPKNTVLNGPVQKSSAKATTTGKKKLTPKIKLSLAPDTANRTALPMPVLDKSSATKEVKKIVPLSQLVIVNGSLQQDTKGSTHTATQVVLQNNSNEILKSVAVNITYIKKENRPLNKETVYFYNVQPGTAPVLNASGNRRATTAHFEIGNIVRNDGSLYLIH